MITLRMCLRYLWMPGSDIFTRRRVLLRKHWQRGPRKVLDAGFGNGWFSWLVYRSGATVSAVALPEELVTKAAGFYINYLKADPDQLSFRQMNLYDLNNLREQFDEIICYETLEHIRDDIAICRAFHKCLDVGGILHLCCPNAMHPRWLEEQLDLTESGGHVRYGYTEADYRALLEPLGFRIETVEGVGGALLVWLQESVQPVFRKYMGEAGAYLIALISTPCVMVDGWLTPRMPFSIYVKAVKK